MSAQKMRKEKVVAQNVLLAITGCIAAYKACDFVSYLRTMGHETRCVMTRNATQFITPLTLQTLTKQRVCVEQYEYDERKGPLHISLAEFPDIVIVMPATANCIAKMTHGIADDLLTSILLAVKCPILVVPAMNDNMWNHVATRKNVEELKRRGVFFVGPVEGRLSSGKYGNGHIAPLPDITQAFEHIISNAPNT